jgi:hypothetical protein
MIFPVFLLAFDRGDYFVIAKNRPMKTLVRLYKQNSIVAFIVNSIAVFIWAATVIFIVTVLAVAFTG